LGTGACNEIGGNGWTLDLGNKTGKVINLGGEDT
jgi:hypothetical protein